MMSDSKQLPHLTKTEIFGFPTGEEKNEVYYTLYFGEDCIDFTESEFLHLCKSIDEIREHNKRLSQ